MVKRIMYLAAAKEIVAVVAEEDNRNRNPNN